MVKGECGVSNVEHPISNPELFGSNLACAELSLTKTHKLPIVVVKTQEVVVLSQHDG